MIFRYFFSTCKYMQKFLCDRQIPIIFDTEELIVDTIKHNCKYCIRKLESSEELMNELFMITCKRLDITMINKNFNLEFEFQKNTRDKYVNDCTLYASKRNNNDQLNLFKFISSRFVITDIELFKIVCSKDDIEIIKNMSRFRYSLKNEQIKILLPYVCKYYFIDDDLFFSFSSLFHNFEENYDNYIFLLNLINDNQNIYSHEILSGLFIQLIICQKIRQSDSFLIAKLGSKLADKKTTEILLDIIENEEAKLLLVEKSYQFELGEKLIFLAQKLEWNFISIDYANKFNSQYVYIGKLSTKQYLDVFLEIAEDKYDLIYGLILKSNKYYDLLNFTERFDEVFKYIVKLLIDFTIHSSTILGYCRDIIKHLTQIPELDIKYKILLVPCSYENWLSEELSFLNDTKELNYLSIKGASENMRSHHYGVKIYTDKLSAEECLCSIIENDHVKIKEILITKIKDKDISKYDELIIKIIDWIIKYDGYKTNIVRSLMEMENIKIKLKILLVPILYKEGSTFNLKFLDNNKELNELSINEALKYKNKNCTIYCKHLDNTNLLKYIVIATFKSNYNLRSQLFKSIKNTNFNVYDINYEIPEEMVYSCVQNMLPSNFVYNDDSYIYEDNEVICKYKLKVSNKMFNLEYTRSILQYEPSYHKIFNYIIDYLYSSKRQIDNFIDLIKLLIEHKSFIDIRPSRVIALLRLYQENNIICDKIINNHKFFESFR